MKHPRKGGMRLRTQTLMKMTMLCHPDFKNLKSDVSVPTVTVTGVDGQDTFKKRKLEKGVLTDYFTILISQILMHMRPLHRSWLIHQRAKGVIRMEILMPLLLQPLISKLLLLLRFKVIEVSHEKMTHIYSEINQR